MTHHNSFPPVLENFRKLGRTVGNSLGTFFDRRQKIVVTISFVIIALAFSYHFTLLRFNLNVEYQRATLSSLLNFTAEIPFQYRVLMIWLTHILADIVPIFHLPKQLWITTSIPPEQACAVFILEMLSIFSLIIAFKYFLKLFFKNAVLVLILSLFLFLVLPYNYLLARYAPFWYPYDIPGQFFFVLGLIFLYKEKWIPYYILFVLATFNRETTAFLTLIFLFTAWGRVPWKKVVFHCVAQGIIWLGIKLLLYQLYGQNQGEGTIIEQHIISNLQYLKTFKHYPLLLSNFGFLWIPVILFHKSIENTFIKRCLFAFIPVFIIHLFTSSILELRIYQEFIPVVIIAYTFILRSLFERESRKPGEVSP